jgi:hypothetical protein
MPIETKYIYNINVHGNYSDVWNKYVDSD